MSQAELPDGRTFLLFKRCAAGMDSGAFRLAGVAEIPGDIFSGGAQRKRCWVKKERHEHEIQPMRRPA